MRPPTSPPLIRTIAVGALVVVTVAIGAWYFLLRGSGQPSDFVRAHERIVAAEREAEHAMEEVTRFVELEEFHATVLDQLTVMQRQAAVFQRIASENDGDTARLAEQAFAAADRVVINTQAYLDAMLRNRLNQVASVVAEMRAGVAELEQVAAEWESLK